MKKITVIYWSGTGNTEMMAEAIAEGAKGEDTVVQTLEVGSASEADAVEADVLVLGCPSMGDEVLEEDTMEPFVEALSDKVKDKKVVLFGSYGWGNGEWMEDWEGRMKGYGADLAGEGLILNETPDDEGLASCRELGQSLK